MKKIISLILILILSLSVLVACGGNDEHDFTNAKGALKDQYGDTLYPTTNAAERETRKDFSVLKQLMVSGQTYTITWSTNSDSVKVTEYVPTGDDDVLSADTANLIDVPEAGAEALHYTLTAKITSPDGKSSTNVEFKLVVPAAGGGLTPVSNPVVDTPYIFGMYQENKEGYYFLKGGMSDYYLATTDANDVASAAHYYLENAEGGYYIYYNVDNVKTYINFVIVTGTDGKEHTNAVYSTAPGTVFDFNANGIFCTTLSDGEEYGFGTYGNYFTLGPNKTSYTTNFFGYFFATDSVIEGGNTGSGSTDSGNTDSDNTGTAPTPIAGVDSLVVGEGYYVTAYNSKSNLWVSGKVTSGRFDAVTEKTDATVFYIEEATEGYLLYTYVKSVKTYIIIGTNTSSGSTTTDSSAATVFNWDSTLKTLVANNRALGAQNTSTYNNLSPYAISNASNPIYNFGQFIVAE